MDEISRFNGAWRGLSNFVSGPVTYQGVQYPTVEVAYQAAKIPDEMAELRVPFLSMTSAQAKRAGKMVTMRPDWADIKLSVMEDLLRQKFKDPHYANLLLSTKDVLLREGNTWGDVFWGQVQHDGTWVGLNHLGQLLMRIRNELYTAMCIDR